MNTIKSICVNCGSSPGADPAYLAMAHTLGRELAARSITLVYGGAAVGLMGAVADAVIAAGGESIGVIPRGINTKVGHRGLSRLEIVDSMHERKARMHELADAFIILPGGLGTLEEMFEIVTWAQLGLHTKACGILNVRGYFDPLLKFLEHAVQERFLRVEHYRMLLTAAGADELLDKLKTYQAPQVEKWLDR